jgi:Domain of unknown function (DUF4062)
MDKRYQVFVSSTYEDLKEERREVVQAVMQLDCIPAGMELFPAADEQQFDFIKRVIDDCDYYLLIIGERYGSTMTDGISYTEKEYNYAVARGLKVIALVHDSSEGAGKSEEAAPLRERLEKFKAKVSANRLVKPWKSAAELPALVLSSLAYAMKTFPAVGWIRANKIASEDLLREANNLLQQTNDLRKQNNELQSRIAEFESAPMIEGLAGLQERTKLFGTYESGYPVRKSFWNVELAWEEIFSGISPYLARIPSDDYVKSLLTEYAFGKSGSSGHGINPELNDQTFRTIALQLQALRLVTLTYGDAVGGGRALFWQITPYGERLMLQLRTVKSAKPLESIVVGPGRL